jgi:raffinose/stachyose/melibiose transport system substrate-binding protein
VIKLLAFAASLAMIVAAAGCGTTPSPAATPAALPEPVPRKVTIRTVSMFGGTDPSAGAYQQLIRDFQARYPNVTVMDESATADETWKARVTTDFSSDNDPDVVFYFTGADAKQLIDNGKVMPLSAIQAEYPGYAGDIAPAAMSFMREADGNAYAVPVRGFWEGLFCNRDLFDRYGLKLPTTWDNLLKAITTFRAKGIIPISVSFSDVPHYWIEHLILAEGGIADHRVNPQGAYPESWETALGYFKTLYDMGAFPADVNATTNDIAGNLFKAKRAAMQLDGSWFMGGIPDQNNTVVVPFPATPAGKKAPSDIIAGFSSGFYISTKAWNDPAKRDAAVSFVMFMTGKDAIGLLTKDSGGPAAKVEPAADLTNLQKSVLALTENAKETDMPIDSRMSKEAWTYFISMVGRVAAGKAAPADVLARVAALNK